MDIKQINQMTNLYWKTKEGKRDILSFHGLNNNFA